jgi:hypothetical protein
MRQRRCLHGSDATLTGHSRSATHATSWIDVAGLPTESWKKPGTSLERSRASSAGSGPCSAKHMRSGPVPRSLVSNGTSRPFGRLVPARLLVCGARTRRGSAT